MQDLMPINGLFEMSTLPYEALGTIVSKDYVIMLLREYSCD